MRGIQMLQRTKAMPVPGGRFSRRAENASRPPAEAPMPTTMREPSLAGILAGSPGFEVEPLRTGTFSFHVGLPTYAEQGHGLKLESRRAASRSRAVST